MSGTKRRALWEESRNGGKKTFHVIEAPAEGPRHPEKNSNGGRVIDASESKNGGRQGSGPGGAKKSRCLVRHIGETENEHTVSSELHRGRAHSKGGFIGREAKEGVSRERSGESSTPKKKNHEKKGRDGVSGQKFGGELKLTFRLLIPERGFRTSKRSNENV